MTFLIQTTGCNLFDHKENEEILKELKMCFEEKLYI
jgi:hypothetical protein